LCRLNARSACHRCPYTRLCRLPSYTGRSKPVFELFDLKGLVRGVARVLGATIPGNVTRAVRDWPDRVRVEPGPAVDPVYGQVPLTCADDGRGMGQATLARLSEPFFTSKPDGRGLGLRGQSPESDSGSGRATARVVIGRLTTYSLHYPKSAVVGPLVAGKLTFGLIVNTCIVHLFGPETAVSAADVHPPAVPDERPTCPTPSGARPRWPPSCSGRRTKPARRSPRGPDGNCSADSGQPTNTPPRPTLSNAKSWNTSGPPGRPTV
jgi:hypothetical protein